MEMVLKVLFVVSWMIKNIGTPAKKAYVSTGLAIRTYMLLLHSLPVKENLKWNKYKI